MPRFSKSQNPFNLKMINEKLSLFNPVLFVVLIIAGLTNLMMAHIKPSKNADIYQSKQIEEINLKKATIQVDTVLIKTGL